MHRSGVGGRGFGQWIGAVIDVPPAVVDAVDAFWTGVLGWTVGPAWPGHPEFHHLEPPAGDSHVLVQAIDGPARIHLDLYVADIDAEAARLVALGATLGERHAHWRVLSSPTGLPFCVVTSDRARERPSAPTWPDGHRSRLAQVCIDVPHGGLDEETAFWQAVTGWTFRESDVPEFAGHLEPGPGGSMQLLVQELGADDPAGGSRVHLDLGTDDIEAEVCRLVELGADRVRDDRGWVVLRDPAGMLFCVTVQSPSEATLPPEKRGLDEPGTR
ncbi:MAG TPA: VOC family protein [Nocardioidaceae bacterium]